jgi:S1-C subfamily serine protease
MFHALAQRVTRFLPQLTRGGLVCFCVFASVEHVFPDCLRAQTPASPTQQTPPARKSHEAELDNMLMQSTFKIQSIGLPGQPSSLGVAFVMGRPFSHPAPDRPNEARFVLITAAHVLDGIPGDSAILNLRRRNAQGDWERVPLQLQIRNGASPLWLKHPTQDIAVMYISVPTEVSIPLASTDMLADDATLERYEIHPGDTLHCLGFPFGQESSVAGFPILRSGMIASYPLTPTLKTKTFLLDFPVFEGNSGGPVYMVDENRAFQGNVNLGSVTQLILGLVTQETTHVEQLIGQYNAEVHRYPLSLATVVHASFIKEAINMLPEPDSSH